LGGLVEFVSKGLDAEVTGTSVLPMARVFLVELTGGNRKKNYPPWPCESENDYGVVGSAKTMCFMGLGGGILTKKI